MKSRPDAQMWGVMFSLVLETKNFSQMVMLGDDGNGGVLRALPASLILVLKLNGDVDVVTGDGDDDEAGCCDVVEHKEMGMKEDGEGCISAQ